MAQVRQVYAADRVTVEIVPSLGRLSNNAYLIAPRGGGGVTIIDAPEGAEAIVEALAGRPVERIFVTHSHRDHWDGFDVLRAHTGAPVFAGAGETNLDASRHILPLGDGATLDIGGGALHAIHTPGHTPGSTCLYFASSEGSGALFTGDTLFPGGPGATHDHAAFERIVESITSKLHTLPGETLVFPGHGDATTIARAIDEYRVFAGKPHPADLAGDVLWLES